MQMHFRLDFFMEANNMNPDQTASTEASLSGSTLFSKEGIGVQIAQSVVCVTSNQLDTSAAQFQIPLAMIVKKNWPIVPAVVCIKCLSPSWLWWFNRVFPGQT